MWSIFGVKLNYIVIFEKSRTSSTLLMELFMICNLLKKLLMWGCVCEVCLYTL